MKQEIEKINYLSSNGLNGILFHINDGIKKWILKNGTVELLIYCKMNLRFGIIVNKDYYENIKIIKRK